MGFVEEIESPEAMGSHRRSLRNKGLCWLGTGVYPYDETETSKWDIKMIYMEYIWLVYNGIMDDNGILAYKKHGPKTHGTCGWPVYPCSSKLINISQPVCHLEFQSLSIGPFVGEFVVADLFQQLGGSINGATHHKKNGISKKNNKIEGTSIYGSRQLCSNHGFLLLKISRKQTIDCLVVGF